MIAALRSRYSAELMLRAQVRAAPAAREHAFDYVDARGFRRRVTLALETIGGRTYVHAAVAGENVRTLNDAWFAYAVIYWPVCRTAGLRILRAAYQDGTFHMHFEAPQVARGGGGQ